MFTNSTPPPAEPQSSYERPYLWEEFSQTPTGNPTQSYLRDVREGQCDMGAARLSQYLTLAYGDLLCVTLAEPSSNIVSRSESLYNRAEHTRLSWRKHFYELDAEVPCTLSAADPIHAQGDLQRS